MRRILIAGANGALGSRVLRELRGRGHWTRALVRRQTGTAADETVVADALAGGELGSEGVDTVFSCLGQTVSADMAIRRPGYREVDIPANLNLIAAAKKSGVRRYVYVSVFQASRYAGTAYLGAHAEVARAVRESGMEWAVIEPTGFFSAIGAMFTLVQQDRAVVFGGGETRSNPIDDGELAGLCADAIESGENAVIPCGGPESFTRRQIFELAFRLLGKPARIRRLPAWAPGAVSVLAKPVAPRVADLMEFIGVLSGADFIAPMAGRRRLESYFQELAGAGTVH